MKKISWLYIVLFITVISAIHFNLGAFLYSQYISLFEFLVSIVYLTIWILVFIYAIKDKEYKLSMFSTIFWSLTCLTAAILLLISMSDTLKDASWTADLIVFIIVFLTPLSGLNLIFTHKYMLESSAIIFSCFFLYFGIRFLIRQRKEQLNSKNIKNGED